MTNATKDTNGRDYLSVADATAGDRVEVDAGFTCIGTEEQRMLGLDDDGLFFECADGRHYLAGQINDAGTHYVGVYPA